MTLRQQEIQAWLSHSLAGEQILELKYLQNDASHRKYLRVQTTTKSFVVMDTKPDQELVNFTQIAKILAANKINVPQIIDSNPSAGLILMSDLGTQTYQEALQNTSQQNVNSLYLDAISTLIKIQRIKEADTRLDYQFSHMNQAYIQARLELFSTWYLQKHLDLALDANTHEILQRMQTLFNEVFAQSPQTLVHVDFHCRNLMVTPSNNPGVLDFQDAIFGPATYDLVSLFQDAYVSWPRDQVEGWVGVYRDFAVEAGIISQTSTDSLLRNFDLVGLQRHIKNLGIFARLHHRDNKSNYLHDIPALLRYITDTCNRYAELSWLLDFIAEVVQE